MGSFDRNMAELAEKVGDGKITGRVSFSPDKQAVPMHEAGWATGPLAAAHPRGSGLNYTTPGTGSHYLSQPFLDNVEGYLRDIAREVLTTGPRIPLERAMDDLLARASERAPKKRGYASEDSLVSSGRSEVSEEFAGVKA